MAENGAIRQKDIDRTYIYFDKQSPEEKKKILDEYFLQRGRLVKSDLEFKENWRIYTEVTKNIGTLKELCEAHSFKLYKGVKDAEVEMVKDIYNALKEIFEKVAREGNRRSYANIAGSRGTGAEAAEGGAAGGTQGGKRRNRNKTKKRKNKNKNRKSRCN
jgi:hypothetical protein